MRCSEFFTQAEILRPGRIESDPPGDFCYNVVKDPVRVFDLNATVLHLLGVDPARLTYRYQGRDFRLTDVGGEVVKAVLT